MREHLVLGHERRRGVLRQHVARLEPRRGGQHRRQLRVPRVHEPVDAALAHVPDRAGGDLEVVGRHRDGLRVKQPGRYHLAALREHDRVVVHRVELDLQLALDVLDRVPRRAHHLRHAA